jgi:hypothetical protein
MAKCPVCDSRKGKRKCTISEGHVCSVCCGQIRKEEACRGCSFFRKTEKKRSYSEVPSFSTHQMEANFDLQKYSNTIEGAICKLDYEANNAMNDGDAINLLELLIDKYHFGDETAKLDGAFLEKSFHYMTDVVDSDLHDVPRDTLVKILKVIHFVAKRRSQGGREYMKVINDLVGVRAGKGVRIMKDISRLSEY